MTLDEIKAALLADPAFIEAVAIAVWETPVELLDDFIGGFRSLDDVMSPIGWPDGIPGIMADTSSLPPAPSEGEKQ